MVTTRASAVFLLFPLFLWFCFASLTAQERFTVIDDAPKSTSFSRVRPSVRLPARLVLSLVTPLFIVLR
jgi:hypothetical protein